MWSFNYWGIIIFNKNRNERKPPKDTEFFSLPVDIDKIQPQIHQKKLHMKIVLKSL